MLSENRKGPIRKGLGLLLVGLGVAGVVLPLMPGVPFLLLGVALLGRDDPHVQRWGGRITRWTGRKFRFFEIDIPGSPPPADK